MADNGLSEAEERYIFNEVGENELMVARINDVIKTARLQTLEDVWTRYYEFRKTLNANGFYNENERRGVVKAIEELETVIKTLREAL